MNGMYNIDRIPERTQLSITLLKDIDRFYTQGCKMIDAWRVSAKENLSKKGINQLAWIGQATCSHCHQATEMETKQAWNNLTDKEQYKANRIAVKIIKYWKERYNTTINTQIGLFDANQTVNM